MRQLLLSSLPHHSFSWFSLTFLPLKTGLTDLYLKYCVHCPCFVKCNVWWIVMQGKEKLNSKGPKENTPKQLLMLSVRASHKSGLPATLKMVIIKAKLSCS
jgi:hypothetical protein